MQLFEVAHGPLDVLLLLLNLLVVVQLLGSKEFFLDPFLVRSQLLVQHRNLAVKGLRQAHERLMVRVLKIRHVL